MLEVALFTDAGGDEMGLSEHDIDQIQVWMKELGDPCECQREEALMAQLCGALAGFMGIESELLLCTIASAIRRIRAN